MNTFNFKNQSFNRLNQILAVALAAQLILVAVVFWPKAAAQANSGPLLGALSADKISALSITGDDGKKIALAKNGNGWVLPDADNFPVNADKVTPVLDKLVGLKTNRLVTRTADSHKRLEVAADKFARKIDLQTADGNFTLYLGSSAGPGATHIRRDGQNETYLTADLSTWELNPQASSWITATYLSLASADVTAFSLKNAAADLSFKKDAGGNWTMAGAVQSETVNTGTITSLLGQITAVSMSRPVSKTEQPAFGLDKPAATVTLTVQPEGGAAQTVTLRVGAKDDAGEYYFHASNAEYFVTVSSYIAEALTNKTRADFIQLPTPEPGATPAAQ